jgi:hypothetical protein
VMPTSASRLKLNRRKSSPPVTVGGYDCSGLRTTNENRQLVQPARLELALLDPQ